MEQTFIIRIIQIKEMVILRYICFSNLFTFLKEIKPSRYSQSTTSSFLSLPPKGNHSFKVGAYHFHAFFSICFYHMFM